MCAGLSRRSTLSINLWLSERRSIGRRRRRTRNAEWRYGSTLALSALWQIPRPTGYTEVNAAPSGDWNCFDFQAYRLGMQASSSASLQSMSAQLDDKYQTRIQVELDLPDWSEAVPALQLGLSAIIEDKQGQRHYYALQHIDGNPDFHHRDTHILTITRGIE